MAKFRSILVKKAIFEISPKKTKKQFFRLQKLVLNKKLENDNKKISRKMQKPPVLGIWGQKGRFWTDFCQNSANYQKSA